MSERRAKIIIQLEDLASKGIKSFVDVFALAKATIATFNETFGRAVEFIKDSIKSFSESELAVSRLNNALKNQGNYSEQYSKALQDQAKELSRVSTNSDEAVLETMTLLTTFGLAGQKLQSTTKAALDLSAGLGVDLRTATLLLGKAWAGETQTLARYGLKVDETLQPMERFAQLQSQISERFGGRAQSDAETYAGKITKLANAWDDLKEKIGEDLAQGSAPAISTLDKLIRKVEQNYDAIKQGARDTALDILASGVGVGANIAQVKQLTEFYKSLTEAKKDAAAVGAGSSNPADPASTNAAVDAEIAAESKRQDDLAELENFGLAESARMKIESLRFTQDQLAAMEVQALAASLERDGQTEAARHLLRAQAMKSSEIQEKKRLQTVQSSLNQVSALSTAKTKELAAIGKAAGISSTIINAHIGAGLALAHIPPPYGFVMAALVETAGLAQAAQIAGVPLAQGGMMLARPGGVHVRMAEAGHDEVAIPLDDERTTERLRNTMGGGDHYHFHVGTLVANDAGLMELARKVDENLFKLGRRNARVSD